MRHNCLFEGCDRSVEHPRNFLVPPRGWVWLGSWGIGMPSGLYCEAHAEVLERALAAGDIKHVRMEARERNG